MASKENNSDIAKTAIMQAYQAQLNVLKLENKKLNDENHSLRIKMAADGKKLVLVREWITNFEELSDHLKEISKDWEEIASVQNENKANASNPVAKLNVDPPPMAGGGLRVMLNRAKLTPRWSTTPTGIVQNSMLHRLHKNIQDSKEMNNVPQAPGPSSSIDDDSLMVEIKTEIDDEAEQVVAPVEPVPKKSFTALAVVVEPQQKVNEKMAKKRKVPEQPKARQTRSKAKAINDEEPSEKRYRLVTPVNDGDDGPAVSRSKSDGAKTIKRLMTKRASNY